MKKIAFHVLCIMLGLLLFTGCAQHTDKSAADKTMTEEIKNRAASFSCIDSLGRPVKSTGSNETIRKDKYVGIFYFLWVGEQGMDGPYDISKILAKNPEAVNDISDPHWGPLNAFHFWGEPMFGYYFVRDEYILRKHCEMLTMANIDFLVFDVTNGYTYEDVFMKLLKVFDEYQKKGWNVPKIVFYTNTHSGGIIGALYNRLYKEGLYKNLWFCLDGKPLIIGKPEECSDELKDFFTIETTQWPTEKRKANGFPWIDFHRPQQVYKDNKGNKIISVSVAQHPALPFSRTALYGVEGNWGRSFHNGKNDYSEGAVNYGYNFQEQWDFALKEDPDIIFITSWNEWIVQKVEWNAGEKPKGIENPVCFVDSATEEFSRDVEPMKGGYGDNYYLQMINNIAKFKAEKSGQNNILKKQTIAIPGDFAQWNNIGAVYYDFTGDTAKRDIRGYGLDYYFDDSGRNDFEELRTAYDDNYIYLYAKTKEPITAYDGKENWMNLLLSVDETQKTGFEGYQFIINRKPCSDGTTSVEKSSGGYSWSNIGSVKYEVSGNQMQIAIPKKLLGISESSFKLSFKWADHITKPDDIMDYYKTGDSAPIGRLNYTFEIN